MTPTTPGEDFVQVQKRSNMVLAILAAIAFALATAPAYSQAVIMAGFQDRPDLADGNSTTSVVMPHGKAAEDLVGLGVDVTDRGYFWWADGTVTQGTGRGAADLAGPREFDLPFGKRVSDIAGMAIDETGDVYTYYRDFTVSVGDPFDLDSVDRPRPYLLPLGYDAKDIVGVGMLGDDVALFFRDGSHHYTDASDYRNFTITAPDYESSRFTLPRGFNTDHIAGMDFADSDGRLYTLFDANHAVQPAGFTTTHVRKTQTVTPHNTVASTADGITIAKDGWSLTLPSGR